MSHDHAQLSKIAAAAVLWGTTGVVVALLGRTTTLTPITIGFYRLAIAAVALLALTYLRRIAPLSGTVRYVRAAPARRGASSLRAAPAPRAASSLRAAPVRRAASSLRAGSIGAAPSLRATPSLRAAPGRLVLTGVFLGAYQALYFIAVANAGVGVATMVSLGIAPIGLLIGEAIRARRRPSRHALMVVTAAVVGLALISAGPSGAAPRPWLGLAAAIGSGLGYAVSALLSRSLADRADPLTLTAATSAIGAVALLPLAAVAGLTFAPSPGTITLLIYLGVITTAVAYGLFYAGLRRVAGSVATVLTLLEPLTAALLAAAILGETLAPAALLGGTLILAAVVMLAIRPRQRHTSAIPGL